MEATGARGRHSAAAATKTLHVWSWNSEGEMHYLSGAEDFPELPKTSKLTATVGQNIFNITIEIYKEQATLGVAEGPAENFLRPSDL